MNHTQKIYSTTVLINQLNSLPEEVQEEALDYVEYLVQKNETRNRKNNPKAGFLKGVFTISKDFDEPLEDFREYMQ